MRSECAWLAIFFASLLDCRRSEARKESDREAERIKREQEMIQQIQTDSMIIPVSKHSDSIGCYTSAGHCSMSNMYYRYVIVIFLGKAPGYC